MSAKLIKCYLYSAGIVLLISGLAKVISGSGNAKILGTPDPIFNVSFRYMFTIVGALEIGIGMGCILGKNLGWRATVLTWLSTSFFLYRIGLLWVGYRQPCHCLGDLSGALHISPYAADNAMKLALGYLLLGSYATLFWLHRQKRIIPPARGHWRRS
jgi:hypothetical protein